MKKDLWNKVKKILICDHGEIKERYRSLYGTRDPSHRIRAIESSVSKKYLVTVVIFIISCFGAVTADYTENSNLIKDDNGDIISVIRPDKEEGPLMLDINGRSDSEKAHVDENVQVTVQPYDKEEKEEKNLLEGSGESYSQSLKRGIKTAAGSVNDQISRRKVKLPDKLEDGEPVKWKETEQSRFPIIIISFLLIFLMIYKTKNETLAKEEKNARDSILQELPEFINKIVLLLNAGVVVNTAFKQIMEDREKMYGVEPTYFYGQLAEINKKAIETNCSVNVEFRAFAKRSRVRELMRFSNIVNDNISKGSDLIEKLQRESETLWFSRKKRSEEKGRIAETKMTLPLMIFLIVLVMITIAPAMLEM